jgi:putative ABC transport system permease protein
MCQDLRLAWRLLRKTPGWSAVAVATLALGIGATTAIFAAVHAVFLRPLPFAAPDRLVSVRELDAARGRDDVGVSFPNYSDWRGASRSFESLAAVGLFEIELRGAGEPARLLAAMTSHTLFRTLGILPQLGRALDGADDREGRPIVAVASHRLWLGQLAGDPGAVGRTIDLGGMPGTLVGVMPAGFDFPGDVDLWVPLEIYKYERMTRNRRVHVLQVVGRLRQGATVAAAEAELDALSGAAAQDDPGHRPRVIPLHAASTRDLRALLTVLMAAVGFLLLIACANVANLLLVRAAGRRRELAVRRALGAGARHLLAQLVAEGLALVLPGAALGLLLAWWGLGVLDGLTQDPRLRSIAIDGPVVAFSVAVSALTGLLFSAAPAWALRREPLQASLRDDGTRLAGGRRSGAARRVLVVAEVSLSLVLLAGAGLMLESLRRLGHVQPGFLPERLVALRVSLPAARYDEPRDVIAFFAQLPDRLAMVPGVIAASGVNRLPISGGDPVGEVTAEGQAAAVPERPAASFRRVLPGYFRTMGIPLRRGRDFDARDDGSGPFVVIVSDSLARLLWPGKDPLGRRIKVGPPEAEPWLTVVGVAADVRHVGLSEGPGLATYEPHAQRPRGSMHVVARTDRSDEAVVASLRSVLRGLEPGMVIDRLETMEDRIARSTAPRRLQTALLTGFAAVAMALASVGLFGVVGQAASQRRREIAIRMALGARGRDVVRMVVGQGLALAVAGVVLGGVAASALTRFLGTLLFEVRPGDPAALAAAAGLLLLVALGASYLPARRAAGVAPMLALRE